MPKSQEIGTKLANIQLRFVSFFVSALRYHSILIFRSDLFIKTSIFALIILPLLVLSLLANFLASHVMLLYGCSHFWLFSYANIVFPLSNIIKNAFTLDA